jgi:mannose-6-phosphate isomerase-like protein (cupin superfamily)
MSPLDLALDSMREVVRRNKKRTVKMPISTVENSDPDEMTLKVGEWMMPPQFPGMRCLLTHEVEETGSKYILCETVTELDCGPHRHPGHVEEVLMMEGVMEDVSASQKIYPGIKYKIPAGETHWPRFDGPALFMVVFRRCFRGTTEGDDRRGRPTKRKLTISG